MTANHRDGTPDGAGSGPDPSAMHGTGYPAARLADALATAAAHTDPTTRERAGHRVRQWGAVLRGMLNGTLRIGSRTPVEGLPAWVTPEVLRGGFATGRAVARGGTPDFSRALHGLTESHARLDAGTYRVDVPEEAALLVLAWLVRAGDLDAAGALLREISPFADQLRFTPADGVVRDPGTVWRKTAADVREALAARTPHPRVETMRATLTGWHPYADELLELWLDSAVDGQIGAKLDGPWRARAARLLDRYRELAAAHPVPRKHRDPRENATILRTCAAIAVDGERIAPHELRRVRHAVSSMVERRGRPGSARHTAVRAEQAANAAIPSVPAFAALVLARVAGLRPDRGIDQVDDLLAPVHEDVPGLPRGAEIPEAVRRIVRRALAGTVEELVDAGIVPSAEVLAEFAPAVAAVAVSAGYADEALRTLMAATYLAFRARRSLLLTDLSHQVSFDELPWVRAVAGHRAEPAGRATARRLGGLVLAAFPGTVVPNPMVRELAQLAPDLPWVEELAADIFQGTFTPKFPAAARLAGELLDGGLYARYYGLDFAAAADVRTFVRWCDGRADRRGANPVVANGSMIEHAQLLTTHNLATLVHAGVDVDWEAAAGGAFDRAVRLVPAVRGPRGLAAVKDVAYAWRQLVFFLSLTASPQALLDRWWARSPVALHLPLAGLAHVVDGGGFDRTGRGGRGRRLLGWTSGRHWLVA
ncbi:hypothetical protein [Actinosynnema sp. NPDC023587]|uniref:hypothetical protein n=1 Tax=Actinosynnema sp. NPDC023587 TaxID=3154695 RepID=UPI0033ED72AF